MNPEFMAFVDVVAAPIIAAIVVWVWKLDQRIFELRSGVLTREEFREEMQQLRIEISELRKAVRP